MKITHICTILVLTMLLTGCGGLDKLVDAVTDTLEGDEDDTPVLVRPTTLINFPLNAANVQSLINGSAPPNLTDAEAERIAQRIRDNADTLLVTDVHPLGYAAVGNIDAKCRGRICTTRLGQVSLNTEISPDLEDLQIITTRNNVPIVQGVSLLQGENGFVDALAFGGWLDYSAFVVDTAFAYFESRQIGWDEAYAGAGSYGDATESRPTSGSATWSGVMVGGDMEFLHPVIGDAGLVMDFADTTLDVSFTNIMDLTAATRLPSMEWNDVQVANDGSFVDNENRTTLRGTFYGPAHQEAGGVFERNNIIGAFGAKR